MANQEAFAVALVLGLSGCPTIDLGDEPSAVGLCYPSNGLPYFISNIEPGFFLLRDPSTGCARAGCHDLQHGGLALDTTLPIDDAANLRATQNYVNCGNPLASELILKPLAGVEGHTGGDLFASPSDPRVVDFLAWFQ